MPAAASPYLPSLSLSQQTVINRLRWIVSSTGFVLSTRHSFVNVWNCCWPILCAFLTASTADGSAISLLSRTSRSSLSSSNGLPSSSITLTSEQTSFLNTFCTLAVWSWWSTSFRLPMSWCASSKSSISATTSGPATIHRRRAIGLFLRPTAPPSLLMEALFCSCAWSMGIGEKTRLVFWIFKLPALNYLATYGCFVGSSVISRRWTGIQRGIVSVVQSKEPGDKCCQSIEVHAEGGLPLGPHKDQKTQLQWHYCCPILELMAALFTLWTPFIKPQRLIFCICVTVIVSLILQDVQCSRCYLVGTSGASNMCCTQEGVGSAGCCNLSLYQCFNAATALQPITQGPQSGHLYVHAAKHHNKLVFSIHLGPLPLDLFGIGVQRLVKCYYRCLPSLMMLYIFIFVHNYVFTCVFC